MITTALIIITCAVSIPAFYNPNLLHSLIFNPYTIKHRPSDWFRFITSGFIHADFLHLGINMFVLWNFGEIVEMRFEELFVEK
jgi:membrane associated rhomboid family serine protease